MEDLRPRPHAAVHSAYRVFNDSVAVSRCKCLSMQRTSRNTSVKNTTPHPGPLNPRKLQAIVLGCVTTYACQHMSA